MSNEDNLNMDDFKAELDASFKKIKEGDLIKGTIIGISETGVTVDLGYYTEGFIPANEVSNDPHFSIREMKEGSLITAVVIKEEDNDGSIVLSLKQATNLLAWDALNELKENKTILTIKVSSAVNAGVIAYVNDIRGFIPASLLSLSYVEDVETFVGKELDVYVTTVEEEKHKLILSAKDVEKDRAQKEKNSKLSNLQKGLVTKGTVEKIMPFGAFVSIGDGLSGLVHISQICGRHIKSPNEVLSLGDEVTVKIMDVKDGKISLSILAAMEDENAVIEDVTEAPTSYSTGEDATTGLASLLANIKL